MKIIRILLFAILVIILTVGLCACSGLMKNNGYTLSADGTSYEVSGIGKFDGTDFVIPSTYKNLPVTSIGDNAFENCTQLISITIPDGVTRIGGHAFAGCCSLTSITIPDGVTSIGGFAFGGCTNLINITIPDSVTRIGEDVFYGCNNLPNNQYDNAYYFGNENNPYLILTKVVSMDIASCTINDACKFISYGAFYGCNDLTEMTIPDGVKSIGGYAFNSCRNLECIIIPDSIVDIGKSAFEYCDNLQYNRYDNAHYLGNHNNPYLIFVKAELAGSTSCTVNDNCKIIYSEAFCFCRSIENIIIPDSVKSIGSLAFYKCFGLKSVIFAENSQLTSIDMQAFSDCTGLTSITIPRGVTSIYCAFAGCTNLTSVMFEDTTTWYRTKSYENCQNKIGGTKTNVSNSSDNATCFADTYCWDYWYKL